MIKKLEEVIFKKFGKRIVKESKTVARERAYRALDVLTELLKGEK